LAVAGCCSCRGLFAAKTSEHGPDGNLRSLCNADLVDGTAAANLDLEDAFLGLDFRDDIAPLHMITRLHEPGDDGTGLHVGPE
jgi:hypothetical protein